MDKHPLGCLERLVSQGVFVQITEGICKKVGLLQEA